MRNILCLTLIALILPLTVLAGPSSTNYELQEYQFGATGTDTNFSSTNFGLFGTAGEIESGIVSSSNYSSNNGLVYTMQSATPPAPTFANVGSNNYNKLHITINYSVIYGSIPSDILFSIALSTNFANPSLTKYVQADHTLGTNPVWQAYPSWGGASGIDIVDLPSNTTFYARVAAKQGTYTQTPLGASSSAATITPTLTMNVSTVNQATPPFTVGLGNLIPGNVVSATDQGKVTINTNSNSGALVYIYSANSGLKSTSQGNYTIATVSSSGQDLSVLSQGYGIRGTSVSQSSGTMTISQPYDGIGNNIGPLDTNERILFTTSDAPITNGVGQFEIKAKSSLSAPPASDYSDILTIITSGSF